MKIIIDFLNTRKQKVVLNGQISSCPEVNVGGPQGSILDPFFFLVYINSLWVDLSSNPKLSGDVLCSLLSII